MRRNSLLSACVLVSSVTMSATSFRLCRAASLSLTAVAKNRRSLRLSPLRGGMDEGEKVFYALGVNIASNLGGIGHLLDDAEVDLVSKGIQDALKGNADEEVPLPVYGPKINELVQARIAAQLEKTKSEGAAMVKKAAAEPDAVTTESGLVIQTITEGDGDSPGPMDKVKVHYHGTLTDGTVFDSSVDRGEPVSFPLSSVIQGWTEGLQLMKVGGKAKFTLPPELAYGNQQQGERIPAGATLVFEVELLEILST